jgi:hypothetical protein
VSESGGWYGKGDHTLAPFFAKYPSLQTLMWPDEFYLENPFDVDATGEQSVIKRSELDDRGGFELLLV